MLLREARENSNDLTFAAGVQHENLPPAFARRCPDSRRFGDSALTGRVDKQADDGCSRHQFEQKFEPLCAQLGREDARTCGVCVRAIEDVDETQFARVIADDEYDWYCFG